MKIKLFSGAYPTEQGGLSPRPPFVAVVEWPIRVEDSRVDALIERRTGAAVKRDATAARLLENSEDLEEWADATFGERGWDLTSIRITPGMLEAAF